MSEHRVCPEHGREERGLNDCREARDWFEQAYMGRLVDVVERKGRFSRTGVAFRGWYDEGQRMIRVQVRTAREADSYEVMDYADNWEVQQ